MNAVSETRTGYGYLEGNSTMTMRSSTPGEPRLIRGLRRGGTFWPGLGCLLADALLPRFWMVLILSFLPANKPTKGTKLPPPCASCPSIPP